MTQAFQAQLIQSAPDGILAFDRECRYLLWNPAMEKLSGLSAKEVLGKVAFDVFPFLKEIGEDQFFLRALQGEVTVSLGRPFEIPSSGKRGFFEGHYSAVLDESGEIVGGMAVIRNVTSRNLEELDFAEKRFHEVIEQAPISIQILSPEGKTLRVNPAWRKLANLSEPVFNSEVRQFNI